MAFFAVEKGDSYYFVVHDYLHANHFPLKVFFFHFPLKVIMCQRDARFNVPTSINNLSDQTEQN